MNPRNIRLYQGSGSYFIEDQYQKDNNSEYKDAYYHYDIDVNRISLYKKNDNEYFIRYNHSNKMDILPLQLKIKNFYYEIHDYNNGNEIIYIENSGKRFFETIRAIWNKIIELININNAPNFVKYTLDDEEFIEADVLKNTSFIKSNCHKDKLIIVLHSVVNNILNASLLELRKY